MSKWKNFRLEEQTISRLQKLAKHFGGNMTAAFEEICDFFFSLEPEFMLTLKGEADKIPLPVSLYIENMIVRQWATESAYRDVFGVTSPRYRTEFRFKEGQLVRGDDLFSELYDEAKQIFEVAKDKMDSGEIPIKKTEDGKYLLEVATH